MVRLPADEGAVNHDDRVVVVAHELARALQGKDIIDIGIPPIYTQLAM